MILQECDQKKLLKTALSSIAATRVIGVVAEAIKYQAALMRQTEITLGLCSELEANNATRANGEAA